MERTRTRVWRDGKLEAEDFPAERVHAYLGEPDTLVWLDLTAPDDLRLITGELKLDPLAVEDATSPHERTKLDRYDGHLFLNVYSVRLDTGSATLHTDRISAFITERALVTVRPDDGFDVGELTSRWDASARLARYGVSYLVHGLLDLVVDSQFEAVRSLDTQIDGLEEALFEDRLADRAVQHHNYRLSKCLAGLRQVVIPMREVLAPVPGSYQNMVPRPMRPYFRDVNDHVLHSAEWIDSLRGTIHSLEGTRLALQDNHLNVVMKKLAGWAGIIAVPTFITGFYGMNLPFPGFSTRWGFSLGVTLIAGSAAVLYMSFRKRDWL